MEKHNGCKLLRFGVASLKEKLFSWNTVDLQHCVNFCWTAEWSSCTYTYILFHIIFHYGILQARILEWVAIPFSRASSQLRDQTWVSCIAGRFFTIWATRKPNSTGVGSLSLFLGIYPTQESTRALLHCRQILYRWTFFFFNLVVACRILVPQPRMEPVLPAVESQTLDHWPPRESPGVAIYEAFS